LPYGADQFRLAGLQFSLRQRPVVVPRPVHGQHLDPVRPAPPHHTPRRPYHAHRQHPRVVVGVMAATPPAPGGPPPATPRERPPRPGVPPPVPVPPPGPR